jgi:hypothetical protein
MDKRLLVCVLGFVVSTAAHLVDPGQARSATQPDCVSGAEAQQILSQGGPSSEDGESNCQHFICSYSCDGGALPGNGYRCPYPCTNICGPWGNICTSSCIAVACVLLADQ